LDFAWLDARVRIIPHAESVHNAVPGGYRVQLVDGVTLAFDAVEQVVTLVQTMPETECVVCDFDCVRDIKYLPMRCHNAFDPLCGEDFCAAFYRTATATATATVHIPRCLFHKNQFV
jgi:hypothetical protein